MHKCPRFTHKFHFCQPPLLIGLGGINVLKLFCRDYIMSADIKKIHLCLPAISNVVVSVNRFFFTRNCMKYPDLHREVIFVKPVSLTGLR